MIINFKPSNYDFLLELSRENDSTIEIEANKIVELYRKNKKD